MTNKEIHQKIEYGVKVAVQKLIETKKRIDGELVYSIDGKIVKIKARELKTNTNNK